MGVHFKDNEEKITIGMIIAGIIIIGILLTSLIVYLLSVNSSKINEGIIESDQIAKKNENTDRTENIEDFEDVSMEIGKSVNEAINEITENNTANISSTNSVDNTNKDNENNESTISTSSNKIKNETKEELNTNTNAKITEEASEDFKFVEPIKGEIIREFAPDSLVYSETLKEWITHNGVDIKADKASEVIAVCDGKVSAIKNDPRYGLTIIIEHKDGYKTVYANLLSAEYVVDGEEVTTGQAIGTIGNSANFEIADDYHLHFEVTKDGEYVDPLEVIK